jgi:transcriptional regulator with XRE-family HTH domain
MENALDTQVKALLEQRRGDWQAIAKGAEVSYSWLSKFANGHIDNPGYATLKRLREYLEPEASPAKAA